MGSLRKTVNLLYFFIQLKLQLGLLVEILNGNTDLHNFGNSFVRNCINRFFDTNIQDIMTGYRAFNYPFIKFA